METDLKVNLSLETLATTTNPPPLKYIPCIYYLLKFKKDQIKVKAFNNFGSEVNVII